MGGFIPGLCGLWSEITQGDKCSLLSVALAFIVGSAGEAEPVISWPWLEHMRMNLRSTSSNLCLHRIYSGPSHESFRKAAQNQNAKEILLVMIRKIPKSLSKSN